MTDDEKKALIRQHNDFLRNRGTALNGRIILTGDLVHETDDEFKMTSIISTLRRFNDFNEDNDRMVSTTAPPSRSTASGSCSRSTTSPSTRKPCRSTRRIPT